jgi:hypothetical protein
MGRVIFVGLAENQFRSRFSSDDFIVMRDDESGVNRLLTYGKGVQAAGFIAVSKRPHGTLGDWPRVTVLQ